MTTSPPSSKCPMHDNIDRRKSAALALKNTKPDDGAYWVKQPNIARKLLRSKNAFQAGAGADLFTFPNPEQAPIFFLDGIDHLKKRSKTQRFLSPQTISDQHFTIMRAVSDDLLTQFSKDGHAKLEDISFKLAVAVVGEILGLTNSNPAGRARRILRVLRASIASVGDSPVALFWLNMKRVVHTGIFFMADVRPAINARKKSPKNDAISFYIEEGYSNLGIIMECLTYGTAGMLTTREFIVMAAWYLFENEALRERFLNGDVKDQMSVLMEILRLEPVAAMIHRRVEEEVEGVEATTLPPGKKYGIDIRRANVDEEMVGECPFAVDPDRAKREKNTGRYLSFGDGPHSCPGWLVALQETRIFLELLFKVDGIKLDCEPDMSWNPQLGSYELRNANISCARME